MSEKQTAARAIRAEFDRDGIVVYQAFPDAVADAALAAQRFVPPFSTERMTWIKPSFLWLMHRSNWGLKRSQERILAVRIRRSGWESALGRAVLTAWEPRVFADADAWAAAFADAAVHLQWDPERSLRGAALPHYSIQVGLSRRCIGEYVDDWTLGIEGCTPRVRKIHALLRDGAAEKARRQLPPEREWPVPHTLKRRLGMA